MAKPNEWWADDLAAAESLAEPARREQEAGITQKEASATNTEVDTATARAKLPYVESIAASDARIKAAGADLAEARAKMGPPRSEGELKRDEQVGNKAQRADVVRQLMLQGIDLYRKDIQGQPIDRGFGLAEKLDGKALWGALPSLPKFERFTTHNQSILPLIRPLVAQSAREGDSNIEMTIFESYIPAAGDNDATIENKYANLMALVDGMAQGRPPSQTESEIIRPQQAPRSIDDVEAELSSRLTPPEPGKPISPLTPREAEYETSKPGEVLTSGADRDITAQLQAAFDEGATADDLEAMAKQLYGGRAWLKPEQVREAVKYRDEFLKSGATGPSGVVIYPAERPQTTEERKELEAADDPLRAAGLELGNTLAVGLAPDVYGGFGGNEAAMREAIQYSREQSPWASFAGGALGAAAPSALGAKGLALAGMAAPKAIGLSNIALGGVQGAAESPGNRVAGGLGGAATAWLGDRAGKYAINPLVQKGLDLTLKGRAPKPSFSQTAIATRIGDADAAEATLREAERLNVPMGVADTSRDAQALAAMAARNSPEAADLAEATYTPRMLGRPERATQAIARDVAQPVEIRAREQAIKDQAQLATGPAYDKAFAKPPMLASKPRNAATLVRNGEAMPSDKAIMRMLDTQDGKAALRNAYKIAEREGIDPKTLNLQLLDNGEVPMPKVLSWEMLDFVKRGIDENLDPYRDNVTGQLLTEGNTGARTLNNFLNRFTARLDDINPDYKAARAAYAEQIKPLNYLRKGIDAAGDKMPASDVERILRDISRLPKDQQPVMLQSFREGFATETQQRIATRKETTDAYSAVFGSPEQQRKMALVAVSPEDFAKQAGLEGQMARTSRTLASAPGAQARNEAGETIGGTHFGQMAAEMLATGAPVMTGAHLAQQLGLMRAARLAVMDKYKMGTAFRTQKRAGEIAPDLMGQDPSEALQTLIRSRAAVSARDATELPGRLGSQLAGGSAGRGAMGPMSSPTYTENEQGQPMPLEMRAATPSAPILGIGEEYDPATDEIVLSDGRRIPSAMRSREALLGQLMQGYGAPQSLGADSLTLGRR